MKRTILPARDPNYVQVFEEWGADEEKPFVVMESLSGPVPQREIYNLPTRIPHPDIPADWKVEWHQSFQTEIDAVAIIFVASHPRVTDTGTDVITRKILISNEMWNSSDKSSYLSEVMKRGVYEIIEGITDWKVKNDPKLKIFKSFIKRSLTFNA